MMPEVGDDGNGFEIVDDQRQPPNNAEVPPPAPSPPNNANGGGGLPPPPSALPSFVTGGSGGASSAPPVDPSSVPPGAGSESFPRPTAPGVNPFSIAASSYSAGHHHHQPAVPPPPNVSASAWSPPANTGGDGGAYSAPAPIETPPVPTAVGLDIPMDSGPFSMSTDPMAGSNNQQPSDPTHDGSAGMMGWFLSKMAEKAKSGVDTMITTLDPQMKEYINASGSIEIAVASDKEPKIAGVKEGFQRVYQHVVARGLGAPGVQQCDMAAQPVGFDNGRKAAVDRVGRLRSSGLVGPRAPIVAVESFLVETEPDRWFDFGCVLADDGTTQCHLFTQATPLPAVVVDALKRHTPDDYPRRSTGFAITTGQAAAECFGIPPTEWHGHLAGVSRRELIATCAASLAFDYKHRCFALATDSAAPSNSAEGSANANPFSNQ